MVRFIYLVRAYFVKSPLGIYHNRPFLTAGETAISEATMTLGS